jgi:hypothetical protein
LSLRHSNPPFCFIETYGHAHHGVCFPSRFFLGCVCPFESLESALFAGEVFHRLGCSSCTVAFEMATSTTAGSTPGVDPLTLFTQGGHQVADCVDAFTVCS